MMNLKVMKIGGQDRENNQNHSQIQKVKKKRKDLREKRVVGQSCCAKLKKIRVKIQKDNIMENKTSNQNNNRKMKISSQKRRKKQRKKR